MGYGAQELIFVQDLLQINSVTTLTCTSHKKKPQQPLAASLNEPTLHCVFVTASVATCAAWRSPGCRLQVYTESGF